MASKGFLMSSLMIGVMLIGFVMSSEANDFYVGGKKAGWVINPSENYTTWAQRNRFQVNDTLIFKYKKGADSVLIVSKEDYDKCNTNNPIKKMDDGESTLKFDRSGPYFFISGNQGNCEKGQKLFLVVMAVRPAKPTTPSSPPPQSVLAPQPSISPAFAPNSDVNNSTAPSPSSSSSTSKYSNIAILVSVVPAVSLLASWSLCLI